LRKWGYQHFNFGNFQGFFRKHHATCTISYKP
jgi:hypothetical protein